MTVLFPAEDVARAPDFKVSHGYLEAAAHFGKFHYRGKALVSRFAHNFIRLEREVGVSHSVTPAYATL